MEEIVEEVVEEEIIHDEVVEQTEHVAIELQQPSSSNDLHSMTPGMMRSGVRIIDRQQTTHFYDDGRMISGRVLTERRRTTTDSPWGTVQHDYASNLDSTRSISLSNRRRPTRAHSFEPEGQLLIAEEPEAFKKQSRVIRTTGASEQGVWDAVSAVVGPSNVTQLTKVRTHKKKRSKHDLSSSGSVDKSTTQDEYLVTLKTQSAAEELQEAELDFTVDEIDNEQQFFQREDSQEVEFMPSLHHTENHQPRNLLDDFVETVPNVIAPKQAAPQNISSYFKRIKVPARLGSYQVERSVADAVGRDQVNYVKLVSRSDDSTADELELETAGKQGNGKHNSYLVSVTTKAAGEQLTVGRMKAAASTQPVPRNNSFSFGSNPNHDQSSESGHVDEVDVESEGWEVEDCTEEEAMELRGIDDDPSADHSLGMQGMRSISPLSQSVKTPHTHNQQSTSSSSIIFNSTNLNLNPTAVKSECSSELSWSLNASNWNHSVVSPTTACDVGAVEGDIVCGQGLGEREGVPEISTDLKNDVKKLSNEGFASPSVVTDEDSQYLSPRSHDGGQFSPDATLSGGPNSYFLGTISTENMTHPGTAKLIETPDATSVASPRGVQTAENMSPTISQIAIVRSQIHHTAKAGQWENMQLEEDTAESSCLGEVSYDDLALTKGSIPASHDVVMTSVENSPNLGAQPLEDEDLNLTLDDSLDPLEGESSINMSSKDIQSMFMSADSPIDEIEGPFTVSLTAEIKPRFFCLKAEYLGKTVDEDIDEIVKINKTATADLTHVSLSYTEPPPTKEGVIRYRTVIHGFLPQATVNIQDSLQQHQLFNHKKCTVYGPFPVKSFQEASVSHTHLEDRYRTVAQQDVGQQHAEMEYFVDVPFEPDTEFAHQEYLIPKPPQQPPTAQQIHVTNQRSTPPKRASGRMDTTWVLTRVVQPQQHHHKTVQEYAATTPSSLHFISVNEPLPVVSAGSSSDEDSTTKTCLNKQHHSSGHITAPKKQFGTVRGWIQGWDLHTTGNPDNITIQHNSPREVTVTWTAPNCGRPAQCLGYKVLLSADKGKTFKLVATVLEETNVTLQGLYPNTLYHISVITHRDTQTTVLPSLHGQKFNLSTTSSRSCKSGMHQHNNTPTMRSKILHFHTLALSPLPSANSSLASLSSASSMVSTPNTIQPRNNYHSFPQLLGTSTTSSAKSKNSFSSNHNNNTVNVNNSSFIKTVVKKDLLGKQVHPSGRSK